MNVQLIFILSWLKIIQVVRFAKNIQIVVYYLIWCGLNRTYDAWSRIVYHLQIQQQKWLLLLLLQSSFEIPTISLHTHSFLLLAFDVFWVCTERKRNLKKKLHMVWEDGYVYLIWRSQRIKWEREKNQRKGSDKN